MDQSAHLFFRKVVTGHDVQEQRFVVVRNVAQVRRQAMQAGVALALLRFTTRETKPFGDDIFIRNALE